MTEDLKKNELTVEQQFAKLDEMLKALDSDEISLEESFHIYENGMKMLKELSGKITSYEKKMQILTADGEVGEFT